VAILCVVAIMSLITVEDRVIIYDCRLAEFHPDFPPKAKEECRKLMKDNISRNII
jgi:hypothetical protein